MTPCLEAQKARLCDRGGEELSVPVGLERVVLGVDHQGRYSDPNDARAWHHLGVIEDRACMPQRSRVHVVDEVPDCPPLLGAEIGDDSLGYPHKRHELSLEQPTDSPIREVSLEDQMQCATLSVRLLALCRRDPGATTGDQRERRHTLGVQQREEQRRGAPGGEADNPNLLNVQMVEQACVGMGLLVPRSSLVERRPYIAKARGVMR